MGLRGPRSKSEFTVVSMEEARRLRAPPGLSKQEREMFEEIVRACPVSQFVESDKPLLVAYCQAVVLSRFAMSLDAERMGEIDKDGRHACHAAEISTAGALEA